jgi:hypothetical protein
LSDSDLLNVPPLLAGDADGPEIAKVVPGKDVPLVVEAVRVPVPLEIVPGEPSIFKLSSEIEDGGPSYQHRPMKRCTDRSNCHTQGSAMWGSIHCLGCR